MRYLGIPAANAIGYDKSAVLSYVEEFPCEANRLLLFHGMIDENVLFLNTAQLGFVLALILIKSGHFSRKKVSPIALMFGTLM